MSGTEAGELEGRATRHTQRSDIQGLRAVAVLVVIASHFGLPGLGGGYVGVDVFFVISGFLITQLLLREVDASERISILGFYARRARRILPAATVVLIATVVASMAVLSASDGLDVVYDAAWATFFAANVHFAMVGTDYFDQDRVVSPLQHYWSLSVEEQFYLVWPLVMLACVVLTVRRRHSTGSREKAGAVPRSITGVVLAVGVAASFAYGVVASESDPTSAYFSTVARAWELGVGAAVAVLAPRVMPRVAPQVRTVLALVGLLGIAVACVAFGGDVQVAPMGLAIPVLGAGLILAAGFEEQGEGTVAARLLGTMPMRLVGDWSYSLYLWHWPVLVLAEHQFGDVGAVARSGLVVATFVLSYLTYRFVETPFRDPQRLPRRRALALYPASAIAVGLTCVVGSAYAHYLVGGFGDDPAITVANSGVTDDSGVELSQDPVVALVQASVYAAEHGRDIPSDLRPSPLDLDDAIAGVGDCDYSPADARELCPRGDVDADRTLVVLGDSHARMWISAFERIALDLGYRAFYLVKPLCPPLDLSIGHESAPDAGPWTDCADFRTWAVEQIAELRPQLVVLVGAGPKAPIYDEAGAVTPKDERGDRIQMGWEKTFDAIAPHTASLALLRDVPWADKNAANCLTRRGADLGDCLFTPDRGHERDAFASMRAAKSRDVRVVRPEPWLCSGDTCTFVVGEMITYTDGNHLTAVYAASLAAPLQRALRVR